MSAALEVDGLTVDYGSVRALDGVSIQVDAGETVAVLGRNGAGKTTLLRAIFGCVPRSGEIRLDGVNLAGRPTHSLPRLGLAYVPEDRGTLSELTVGENLQLAALGARQMKGRIEEAFATFPLLEARRRARAGTLSGGQQQMLSIARALVGAPRLLMLDEPSLGLAPTVVDRLFTVLEELHARGVTILLVEQNVRRALAIASRGYLLSLGRVAMEASSAEILADDRLIAAYLGGRPGSTPPAG